MTGATLIESALLDGVADADERASAPPEGGFVLPVTALILIPLMVFAAFAVDVGAWYSEAARAQRAADAAALAGVVNMPDLTAASTAAKDQAARNGFVDEPGCDTLPCTPTAYPQVVLTPDGDQALRVNIITEGELYFGSVVLQDSVQIERYGIARYVPPVPMGNPSSALGTGNQAGVDGAVEGIWLAVNGFCSGRQQGDHIMAEQLGTSWLCAGDGPNPTYDPEGLYLVIDMPVNSDNVDWNVEFHEPGACADGRPGRSIDETVGYPWDVVAAAGYTGVRLETTLYRADTTQFDDSDNITAANRQPPVFGVDGDISANRLLWDHQAGCDQTWQTAFTIARTDPRGRWLLNYRSLATTTEVGSNYFSVRLTPRTGPNQGAICSTLGGGADECPQVSAKDWLPVYAPGQDTFLNPTFTAGEPANFYLAEIAEIHAGKTLELTLFDPGEGMDNLQIITPNRDRPNFTWATVDCAELGVCLNTNDRTGTASSCWTTADPATTPASQVTTTVDGNYRCLDVIGDAFQNQMVRIRVDIADDYTCAGDNCWWRIRYEPDGAVVPTDRTMWSARVTGDPIRLTE